MKAMPRLFDVSRHANPFNPIAHQLAGILAVGILVALVTTGCEEEPPPPGEPVAPATVERPQMPADLTPTTTPGPRQPVPPEEELETFERPEEPYLGAEDMPELIMDEDAGIRLPEGFDAAIFHPGIGRARHIIVRDNGDVYVNLREVSDGGGIVALRDTDGDGEADRLERFTDVEGTGIDIHNGYLYYSSNDTVYRQQLVEGELVPAGEPETIVSGLTSKGQHAAKAITFDNEGNLYVDIGAPSNACQQQTRTPNSPGMRPCPLLEDSGGIWRFDADQPGQVMGQDGERFVTGVRHAVALEWNPIANHLYMVMHGRDQLNTLWPEHFTAEENAQLPAEEFHLLREGGDYGWPYTYYDHLKMQRMIAPEYGGDGETPAEEGKYPEPIAAMPGHWAPNDLLFYTAEMFPPEYVGGAFIAFHGSWNRAPLEQAGYKVVFVPFDGVMPSGPWWTFADGFPGVDPVNSPGQTEHRPMGVAQGPEGELYIADSKKGTIWRVTFQPERVTEEITEETVEE